MAPFRIAARSPLMRESRDPFSLGAPSADVTRSRKIARKTIDRPASVPLAILIFASAETTSWPSPSAPTIPAMTAMDRASMMTWLTPAMIVGMARGS